MQDLLLKGSRLTLTLSGHQESRDGWAGSEYYERKCTYHDWHGIGVLIHNDSREITQFSWDSWTSENHAISFENAVFYPGFYAHSYYSGLEIIDYTAFIDYFIDLVVKKLAEYNSDEDGKLSHVELPELDMKYMRENGIVPNHNGQVCFNLGLEVTKK